MSLEFAVEAYSDAIEEMRLLYPINWAETGTDELDPDYERYLELESRGMMHVVTARDAGELVGYHQFIISTHLHRRHAMVASTDTVYLKKSHRKGFNGVRFLEFAFSSLPPHVHRVSTMCTTRNFFGKVLERLGFRQSEQIYTKVL